MPSFPVTIHAIGSPEGPMTLPEFFEGDDPHGHLVRELKARRGNEQGLVYDFLTFEATTRPAPFNLPPGVSKVITKKALRKEYPVVEIAFGDPLPAAAPAPAPAPAHAPAPPAAATDPCVAILREAGISSRSDFKTWALRNHPDKGGDTATFQQVSNCVDKQYGSARRTRRKGRKNTRRRRRTTGRR